MATLAICAAVVNKPVRRQPPRCADNRISSLRPAQGISLSIPRVRCASCQKMKEAVIELDTPPLQSDGLCGDCAVQENRNGRLTPPLPAPAEPHSSPAATAPVPGAWPVVTAGDAAFMRRWLCAAASQPNLCLQESPLATAPLEKDALGRMVFLRLTLSEKLSLSQFLPALDRADDDSGWECALRRQQMVESSWECALSSLQMVESVGRWQLLLSSGQYDPRADEFRRARMDERARTEEKQAEAMQALLREHLRQQGPTVNGQKFLAQMMSAEERTAEAKGADARHSHAAVDALLGGNAAEVEAAARRAAVRLVVQRAVAAVLEEAKEATKNAKKAKKAKKAAKEDAKTERKEKKEADTLTGGEAKAAGGGAEPTAKRIERPGAKKGVVAGGTKPAAAANAKPVKWKKIIAKELETEGGSMKLKELRSACVKEAKAHPSHEGRDGKSLGEDFDTHFGTFMGINGKFVLDGKRVRLAPERG